MTLPVLPESHPSASAAAPVLHPVDRSRPYPSCPWIEEGLSFNRRSLNCCLIVHHDRGYPFLADFNGGEVDMEAIAAARARIIRANQKGVHDDCRGCPHLVTRQWPEPAFPFRMLGIAHFSRCNIACEYCFLQWQDPSDLASGYAPYAVMPAIRGLIREGLLAPDAIVDWGGGEPAIYPEFESLLHLLSGFGATTYIHTNGTRFPRAIGEGLQTRRIGVICSVDAGTAGTWHRIKGRNLFNLVWRNIQRYMDHGCRVTLKYIVMDGNCGERELRAFVREANRAGINELVLDIDYRHPVPGTEVLHGLQRLKYLAVLGGMHVSCGFAGTQFTPEIDIATKIDRLPDMTRFQHWVYRFHLLRIVAFAKRLVRRLPYRFCRPLKRSIQYPQQ